MMKRFLHNQILCRFGLHDERSDDPSIGWSCRWCNATGLDGRRR